MKWLAIPVVSFLLVGASSGETFRVATYNLENYTSLADSNRPFKTDESKAKLREGIRALHPDVLAVQEMGGTNQLLELQSALQSEGVALPFWEWAPGYDTNIHVAVLSRLPIVARRSHTNEAFLLDGRRVPVSRAFAEIDIQVNPGFQFTLLSAHLKSKRPVPEADESDLREQEAILLRGKISARLSADPQARLIVLGDFNDTKDSKPIKTLIGRGKTGLIDTRPAERNGDDPLQLGLHSTLRTITWTHYYAKDDVYSRIDYILISRALARAWKSNETYVLNLPNWGVGSDHRPLVATFETGEK